MIAYLLVVRTISKKYLIKAVFLYNKNFLFHKEGILMENNIGFRPLSAFFVDTLPLSFKY